MDEFAIAFAHIQPPLENATTRERDDITLNELLQEQWEIRAERERRQTTGLLQYRTPLKADTRNHGGMSSHEREAYIRDFLMPP